MNIARARHLPLLLLSLAPACTIDKDLLDGLSAGISSSDVPGTSSSDELTGETGNSTTEIMLGESSTTGDGADTDFETSGKDGTTDAPPHVDPVSITPDAEHICMPSCVLDVDPSTEPLDPNCQMFVMTPGNVILAEIVPCEVTNFVWVVPAGEPRCFAELLDKGDQTPSPVDQLSETCSELGFNLEIDLIGDPVPEGLFLGALCEPSDNLERDCPET